MALPLFGDGYYRKTSNRICVVDGKNGTCQNVFELWHTSSVLQSLYATFNVYSYNTGDVCARLVSFATHQSDKCFVFFYNLYSYNINLYWSLMNKGIDLIKPDQQIHIRGIYVYTIFHMFVIFCCCFLFWFSGFLFTLPARRRVHWFLCGWSFFDLYLTNNLLAFDTNRCCNTGPIGYSLIFLWMCAT